MDHCLTPTPIVALTMYALRDDEEMSLSTGITAHLTKPIKRLQLSEVIGQSTKKVTVWCQETMERMARK